MTMTEKKPSDLRLLVASRWLWIGLTLLVLGTGPLVVVSLYEMAHGDPNPNPVGPGMCAGCTFWPAVVMSLTGLFTGIGNVRQRRRLVRLMGRGGHGRPPAGYFTCQHGVMLAGRYGIRPATRM